MTRQGVDRPPRVSVITIFYNAERYFREAIDSVLDQEFSDFELILVDDGSTDSSTEIARDYQARDRRIRYFEHPAHANFGMSASRNVGLSQARGDFVAFIDADDRWRPSKLTQQLALLDAMPAVDAVGGSVNYWASHGGGKDRLVPTGHVQGRAIPPAEATLALYPLGKADAPSMSDLMFRRATIDRVGSFEESFTGAYEDQAFLAKYYLRSTLYFTDSLWSDYRLHDGSCMAKVGRSGTYGDARRAFLEWFERYLAETFRDRDAAISAALARALQPYRAKHRSLRETARAIPYAVPLVRASREIAERLRVIMAPGPAILMYHRIADERFDPWGLAVSPSHFAEHVEWIARHRRALPLAEFARLHGEGKLPDDAVALTFDDGYCCNSEFAVPVLQEYRVPATIFIPAALIGAGREFWWDDLGRIVLSHPGETLRLNGEELALGERHSGDEDWRPAEPPSTPRQRVYHQVWAALYKKAPREIDEIIEDLRDQAQASIEPRKSHRPMTRDELTSIRSEFVEFGSHSLSHASMPLLSRSEKAREVSESFELCAEITGSEPRSFAYPYGDLDPETERLVAQAGYSCACRADGKFVRRRSSRFALPRLFVGNWDTGRLARQLGRP